MSEIDGYINLLFEIFGLTGWDKFGKKKPVKIKYKKEREHWWKRIEKNPYMIKTPQLCEMLGVTRLTLYNWEKKGIFTPPRNTRGDRVFTEKQAREIIKAFSPGGKGYWHFKSMVRKI